MSNITLLILIVVVLTILGTGTLVFITTKYYWGERGTPPLSREERRRIREENEKRMKRENSG